MKPPQPHPSALSTRLLALIAAATFAAGAFYAYALLVWVPAPGFNITNINWRVASIDPEVAGRDLLRVDDELLKIGPLTREQFRTDRRSVPFAGAQAGDPIAVTRWRAGAVADIVWVMPPISAAEVWSRLSLTLPTVIFFLMGLGIHLLLRPRNLQWLLLASLCYLTALWLMLGVVSSSGVAASSAGLHAVTWLLAAVLIDLHVEFPRPLWPGRDPRWRLAVYGPAAVLAGLELLWLVPQQVYLLGLMLAMGASLVSLLYRLASKTDVPSRAAAGLMLAGISLAFGPGIILRVLPTLLQQINLHTVLTAYATLFAVPLLPLFYAYAIYKHHLGGLEFRANRAISIYLFLLVTLMGLAVVGGTVEARLIDAPAGATVTLVFAVGLVAVLAAIVGFGPFQRWVERRLLGVPPAPTGLVQTYAGRIGTSLELPTLVRLLRDEVLPTLLVRQSALLCQEADGGWRVLYAAEVPADHLPAAAAELLEAAGRYRPPTTDTDTGPAAWVRLPLRLQVPGQRPGLWLLGRRDPNDFYAASELPVLQTLADQTAVALLNIRQAEDLHALYQANVERAETERSHLARELHDGPLNEFGRLANKVEGGQIAPDFQATYASAVSGLRHTIAGLRPIMLSYGLPSGLQSLVSDLGDQWPAGPEVQLETPLAPCRYPEPVETHAYRIVQQACVNALRHAGARTIRLHGTFDPDRLDLTVEDDGRGFEIGADFTAWLAQRHFGLAGMRERAALIGGELHIHSAPGAGTRLRLVWPANGQT